MIKLIAVALQRCFLDRKHFVPMITTYKQCLWNGALVYHGEWFYAVFTYYIKSGALDITIGIVKHVAHFNGENTSFSNIM